MLQDSKLLRVTVGAPSLSCEVVVPRWAPGSPPEAEDQPMDDVRSLAADCIVDLDSLEDFEDDAPRSNAREQMQMGQPVNSFLEDDMEEDEDVIEDDDD